MEIELIKEADAPASKGRIASYLYFSSLYFIATGVLYLWGYWTPFNVNILEYMSLSDVLKTTAYSIALTAGITMVGTLLGAFSTTNFYIGLGARSFVMWFRKHLAPLIWTLTGFVYVIFTLLLLVLDHPAERWLVLPVLLALPVALAVSRFSTAKNLIREPILCRIVAFMVVLLPLAAYGLGKFRAEKVLSGDRFQYVVSEVPGISIAGDDRLFHSLRFLGHAGDFVFMLNPNNNSTIISKIEDGKPLELKAFDEKHPRFIKVVNPDGNKK